MAKSAGWMVRAECGASLGEVPLQVPATDSDSSPDALQLAQLRADLDQAESAAT